MIDGAEALGRELAGAQALEVSLAAAIEVMQRQADEVEREWGPQSARHVRDEADEVERRRERTAHRVKDIEERIAWQRKQIKSHG